MEIVIPVRGGPLDGETIQVELDSRGNPPPDFVVLIAPRRIVCMSEWDRTDDPVPEKLIYRLKLWACGECGHRTYGCRHMPDHFLYRP